MKELTTKTNCTHFEKDSVQDCDENREEEVVAGPGIEPGTQGFLVLAFNKKTSSDKFGQIDTKPLFLLALINICFGQV
jgi:hypothetical protein